MAGPWSRYSMLRLSSFSLCTAFRNISLSSKRQFSATLPVQKTKILPDHIPPYPYGPNLIYKQSNFGLYGGSMIRFGNKISKGRNKGKTRRSWKPNVRRKKIYSEALEKDLFIKVTRRALRSIEKAGSLDKYLLGDHPSRIKEMGIFGWHLRWQLIQTPKIQEQFREERKKLGLPEPPTLEEWMAQKEKQVDAEVQELTNIKTMTKPIYTTKLY